MRPNFEAGEDLLWEESVLVSANTTFYPKEGTTEETS